MMNHFLSERGSSSADASSLNRLAFRRRFVMLYRSHRASASTHPRATFRLAFLSRLYLVNVSNSFWIARPTTASTTAK